MPATEFYKEFLLKFKNVEVVKYMAEICIKIIQDYVRLSINEDLGQDYLQVIIVHETRSISCTPPPSGLYVFGIILFILSWVRKTNVNRFS